MTAHEERVTDPVAAHAQAVRTLDAVLEQVHRRALRKVQEDGDAGQLADLLTPPAPVAARPTGRTAITLMGSSQAGKSTLLDALTGEDTGRPGKGFTNTSTDVAVHPVPRLDGVDLLDPPGIGTKDSEQFEPESMEAARTADLVLWVQPDDALLADTEARLRQIVRWGRRVLLVINVKRRLEPETRRRSFLKDPERAFREASGHIELLQEKVAEYGVKPVGAVAVHAQAARLAVMGDPDAGPLQEASRLEQLLSALKEHASPTAAERIRADALQSHAQAEELGEALRRIETELRETVRSRRGVRHQAEQQSAEVLERIGPRMEETVERLGHRLADWMPDESDSGRGTNRKWRKAAKSLTEELIAEWETQVAAVNRALEQPVDVDPAAEPQVVDTEFEGVRGAAALRARKIGVMAAHRLTRAGLLLGKHPALMVLAIPAGWGADKLRETAMPESTAEETLRSNRSQLKRQLPVLRRQQISRWRRTARRLVRDLQRTVARQLAELKAEEDSALAAADALAALRAQVTTGLAELDRTTEQILPAVEGEDR